MPMPLEPQILMECPRDAEFVELFEGRLAGPDAARLEQHLAGCTACRALVDDLMKWDAELSRAIVAVLGGTPDRRVSIGRYRILSLIGRGGMGEVLAAYDPELD